MSWFKKKVKEKKLVEYELAPTVINFITDSDSYTVTFEGMLDFHPMFTGLGQAIKFLSENKNFIRCDNNQWIPTRSVKKVTVKSTSRVITKEE